MMFRVFFLLFLFFSSDCISQVRVKGYYRKNGTYVRPHYRSSPNSTINDNWSTKGNINPYTGKKGWIARDGNYYINGLSNYNESDLYFLNNCNESKIDDNKYNFCVDILLDKVKQDVKYRNRLIADGFYSDYTFFEIDLNQNFESIVGNEINSILFKFSEAFWIGKEKNVYESKKILQTIDKRIWNNVIFLLPEYNKGFLKDESPLGVLFLSKKNINHKRFHKKLKKDLIKKYKKPQYIEEDKTGSLNSWIGLNFKIYLHFDASNNDLSLSFYKLKIYENLID